MDGYRFSVDPEHRREELERLSNRSPRRPVGKPAARPIRIGRNAWIGFDACLLPGVTIGEGAIIGARSVIVEDVPPYTIVVGNPARIVKRLDSPRVVPEPC
jgi:acetyltransferase-like isoleucine patch superfamily enzyme